MSSMAMAGDHAGALVALLYLPVVLVAAAVAVDRGAAAGWSLARGVAAGYQRASAARRLLLLLLSMSAAVHLGLVPGHLDEDRVLAALFALDGVALTAAAVTGFEPRLRGWRAAVAGLLLANLVGYAGYLAAGLETADAIGIATKGLEVMALGLVIHPAAGFVGRGERGNRPLATITERRIAP